MKAFIAALKRAHEQFTPIVESALDEISRVAQRKAKSTTLFGGSMSGGLRGSIKIIKNGRMSRTVIADKDYAGYVEYGNFHGPNGWTIKAKPGGVLKFKAPWSKRPDGFVFYKSVRAHGPLPFMNDAKEYTIDKIHGIMEKHIGKIL